MSAEAVAVEEAKVATPREPLLSKRRKKFVSDPLDESNPVTVQVLGICSALAVTIQVRPTLVMSLSVIAVVVLSNVIVSSIRNKIPSQVRIIVQLAIVAGVVAMVDLVLKAFVYDVSKQLSVFVGLIITNCIVMGRLEAFAMGNRPFDSAMDGLGSGLGYAWVILAVAVFRELLGAGKLFGVTILDKKQWALQWYEHNGLMVTPVGAFIILGIIIWVQRSRNGYVEE